MARVIKIVELMGVSEESFDDAVRQAVKEAAKTIRNITGVEVIKNTADVDGDEIFEYHVTVRLAFVIDREQAAADEDEKQAESGDEEDEQSEAGDEPERASDEEDEQSEAGDEPERASDEEDEQSEAGDEPKRASDEEDEQSEAGDEPKRASDEEEG